MRRVFPASNRQILTDYNVLRQSVLPAAACLDGNHSDETRECKHCSGAVAASGAGEGSQRSRDSDGGSSRRFGTYQRRSSVTGVEVSIATRWELFYSLSSGKSGTNRSSDRGSERRSSAGR